MSLAYFDRVLVDLLILDIEFRHEFAIQSIHDGVQIVAVILVQPRFLCRRFGMRIVHQESLGKDFELCIGTAQVTDQLNLVLSVAIESFVIIWRNW